MRIRLHLERRGWRVTRAATGAEMRDLLFVDQAPPRTPFDLLLLDYHLPDTNGDVLCREVRSAEVTREMPILMLTSAEEEDAELRGLQSGADDYVSKSAPSDVLIARLEILLNQARARRDLSALYEREHRVAQVLQETLLATAPEDAFPGLRIRTIYEPAWNEADVGGDFFDLRAVPGNQTMFMVGDVAGKGLQAATFTAEVKFALRALLHECSDPGTVLTRLNNYLVQANRLNPWTGSPMVGVCLALCDASTGAVRIASAGMEPPLLLSRGPDGEARASEFGGFQGTFLGVSDEMGYETGTLTLNAGDVLMLFTDGITEARQRKGSMMGYDAVAQIARDTLAAGGPDVLNAIVDAVVRGAKSVAGGHLLDDACLIAVQKTAEVPAAGSPS